MSYQSTILPNGLRIASEFLPGVESVSVNVSVDVGARYETEAQGGISHLLEHMAFKGTERRSARQIAEEFDLIGGHFNAYTSLEHTVYYAKVLKQDLHVAVDILCDILQHSTFDPEELEREKQVIVQELAMHNDTPDDLVFDYFSEATYPDQPLGRSILGTEKQITSHTRAQLQNYMQTYYLPHRMVVSAAGAVNHEELVALIQQHFTMPASDAKITFEPARYVGSDVRQERDLEQLQLVLGWPGVRTHDADYYTMQVLSTILGGGTSSRLFQEVREKRGLVYSINAFSSSYVDTGVFGIYASTSEALSKDLVSVTCDQVLGMTKGVGPDELLRAKNQIKASLLMSRESTVSVAEWIGRHMLYFNRYKTAAEISQQIDAITEKDIVTAAEKILHGGVAVTALGPISQLESYDQTVKRLAA